LPIDSYKERLGQSEQTNVSFNMQSLLANSTDLSALERPFTHKKIDDVVAALPHNKPPGPDGSMPSFFSWPIIKNDFYDLCDQFDRAVLFLFLKRMTQLQYRLQAYFLLSCTVKVLTKLLANRLQTVTMSLIHADQYGFIPPILCAVMVLLS
jgi:hypothetical protein